MKHVPTASFTLSLRTASLHQVKQYKGIHTGYTHVLFAEGIIISKSL